MTRSIAVAVMTIWCAVQGAAQETDRSSGGATATVLQLTTTPRAASLGDALGAANELPSLFANPAGVASVPRLALHLAHHSLFEGSAATAAAAGFRPGKVALGLGMLVLDLGSVEEVVCDGCGGRGTATGRTLSASEVAITAAGAIPVVEWLSLGAAVNYFSTDLAGTSASAPSVSLGARARFHPRVTVGASLQYLGGDVDAAGYPAPLPRTARLAAELRPLEGRGLPLHLVAAAELRATRGWPTRLGGGLEFGVSPPASRLTAVGRIGWRPSGEEFGTDALRVGGGIRLGSLSIDYAYQGSAILDALHRIGVTYHR